MTDFTNQQSTQKNKKKHKKKTNKQTKHPLVFFFFFLCWCVSDPTAIDQPTKARAQTTLKVILYFELASAWDSLSVSSVSLPQRSVGPSWAGPSWALAKPLGLSRPSWTFEEACFFDVLRRKKKTQTLTQLRVRFGVLQVHRALSWGAVIRSLLPFFCSFPFLFSLLPWLSCLIAFFLFLRSLLLTTVLTFF